MPTQKDFARLEGMLVQIKQEAASFLYVLNYAAVIIKRPTEFEAALMIKRNALVDASALASDLKNTIDDTIAMYDKIDLGEKP